VLHAPLHVLVGLPLMQRWFGSTTPGLGLALAYMAAMSIASYGAGWLSYRLLEGPFLRLRRPVAPAPGPERATAS